MSDDFRLTILLTILVFLIGTWLDFEAQNKHKKGKIVLVLGGLVTFMYSIYLLFHFGSIEAFLYGFRSLFVSCVKWWQVVLLVLIAAFIIFFKKRRLKSRIDEKIKKEEKELVSTGTRKGKELPIFKWIDDKEDMVGKGTSSLHPDGEGDGSFLLVPRRNGKIISLDLKAIKEDGSETGERWTTLSDSCWPLAVIDLRTRKRVNETKNIKKSVRKETELKIYAAKTARGFKGKYKVEIGFSDGKKKTLQTYI